MKRIASLAVVLAAVIAGNARAQEVENVRTIITKATADSACPVGSTASYVPSAYRGKTGSEICAADFNGWKACVGVKFFYVTAENKYGRYQPYDGACWQPVNYPWPWGVTLTSPDTLATEWSHGNTYVVCCY